MWSRFLGFAAPVHVRALASDDGVVDHEIRLEAGVEDIAHIFFEESTPSSCVPARLTGRKTVTLSVPAAGRPPSRRL